MTLPASPFKGANFFAGIRAQMNRNRGLFGGSEGDLQYVVMDAALYRLEIFRRPGSQNFTDAGKALGQDIRVLVNGQTFASYNYTSPGPVKWAGEIVVNGSVPSPGKPPSKPDHRFIGRQNAIPIWRYFVNRGDPSKFSPSLQFAMGALLPLIQGRIRFGLGNERKGTTVIQIHSGGLTKWFRWPAKQGKTVVGIHRTSGCLFVICQEDGASSGMTIATLIGRLQTMGVDDAVLCDGSNSAGLMVDSTFHVTPGWPKNDSIPTGLMFKLKPIVFRSGGTFTVGSGTTDTPFKNNFPAGTVLSGVKGTITANTKAAGGLDLSISSFGTTLPAWSAAGVAKEMGINSLPITLTTTSTNLTAGVTFFSKSPDAKLSLRLTRTAGNPDTLRGTLTVKVAGSTVANPRGTVTGAVAVPI